MVLERSRHSRVGEAAAFNGLASLEVVFESMVGNTYWYDKFPSASELQFLVGKEIGQVCLDPYSLQFRFVDGAQITAELRIEHIDEAGQTHPYNCQAAKKENAIHLDQLLQRKIKSVATDDFCLSLHFDNGAILKIFSEVSPYESGHISGQTGYIVFWVQRFYVSARFEGRRMALMEYSHLFRK
jgi:hypothetical protein